MNSENIKKAEEILKEETGELREFRPHERLIFDTIAVGWAFFQLALASFLILNSTYVRAIHLAFAMALVFLSIPFFKKPKRVLRFLSVTDKIPLIDYIFAILGVVSALYIVIDYNGIAMRAGSPLPRDVIFGLLLIVVLLEATRRSIGPALSFIAIVFSLYAFFGPYMPDVLAYKGVTLTKYVNQLSLSTEGIYGIPLGVSASIVYLFVLLGSMLDRAGAGKFFIDLAVSLLGKYKGGPAKAAIVSSALTGLVSGSSIANIVTTGTFTIPLMKSVGYPAKKAAATEVAASTDGQLMPPIMGAAAFIIAEYVNVPYIEVVKAAAIPAFVSYFALFFVTHLEASKLGLKGLPKEQLPDFKKTLRNGLHYLIPIGMLVYELVVLRHSPELAAFRAIIVLAVIIFIQEFVKFKRGENDHWLKSAISIIKSGFVGGSRNMISVALATASAGIIVGLVNTGIGSMITEIVENLAQGNIFLLLVITAIASLLLGMGLPTTATYIVMASLTAPIIVEVGASYGFFVPLMAAHLFCFYFGILADDTPPVGLASYAAAALADSEPIPTGLQGFLYDMRTAIIPFMFVFNPDLILHQVYSWPLGILIFVMAVFAAFAFTSVIQGWLITKNKWFEIPFLLVAALILFNPEILLHYLPLGPEYKYYMYIPGLALFFLVLIEQKLREKLV
ncbi:TRAP-type transport system, permease component [Deferribacter desulfuricans SSM1]|uniref:TRAP-type transport system, permease component n=1 Tax=Deferribacter desulfuricans (strain DSM 14783 / JCM 11476 / NBRC 101012 / SSM1) TaxID=639282 RepID=D3P9B1_DEFDS|nr:TRAP transporter permease [Deferribacter desulfuricans]BAI81301.1 TRAP-type transport system, permease component [Deferribacter desulfuricans SSM1]